MERHVKERLVGAAVLVAAAVILIPEMLSGPESPEPQAQAPAAAGTVKTYTIDLSRPPGTSPAIQNVSEQAPPPETVVAETLPTQQAPSESGPTETSPESSGSAPPSEQASARESAGSGHPSALAEQSRDTVREAVTAAPAKPAPQERVRTEPESKVTKPASSSGSSGWVVQVGSFASQGTAAKLAKDLRADGYESFVMPVKSGGSTLYRVRIGPVKDREDAVRTLNRLKGRISGAAVVKHP